MYVCMYVCMYVFVGSEKYFFYLFFLFPEISSFISRFVISPENKAAAAAVSESDTAAVAAEVDNPDLITTQSVSCLSKCFMTCPALLP